MIRTLTLALWMASNSHQQSSSARANAHHLNSKTTNDNTAIPYTTITHTIHKNVLMKFFGNLIRNIVLKIRFLSVSFFFCSGRGGWKWRIDFYDWEEKEKHALIMCYYEYFCCFHEVFVDVVQHHSLYLDQNGNRKKASELLR